MNRRSFLRVALIGGGATVIVPQSSVFERLRSYFFAPAIGWSPSPQMLAAIESISLDAFAKRIPYMVFHESTMYKMFRDARPLRACTDTFRTPSLLTQ